MHDNDYTPDDLMPDFMDDDCVGAWGEPERPEGDVTVTVYRPVEGQEEPLFLTVSLVAGDAPWATCRCGKVVVGPPNDLILSCCGVAESTLPWNDGSYWVLDALDEDGNDVTLSPSEYRDALATATAYPDYTD